MPNTILLKRASTAGRVPVTANLSLGELSINSTDGRLYTTTGSAIVDLTQNDKITLSGDATGTSTNPAAGGNYSNLAVTLATVNSNTGTWGGANGQIPFVTVNAKGLITAAGNIAVNTVAVTNAANTTEITANATVGTVGFSLTNTGVSAGNYGSATSIPTIVVDAKGRVTSLTTNAVSTTISLAGSSGSGSVAGGGTLTVNGSNGIATSVAGSTITISGNGTVLTANVSLYESVTASTTNATFYPMLSDKTDGNTASFSSSTLSYNPSTGLLTTTQLSSTTVVATNFSTGNAVISGGSLNNTTVGATTPNTGRFTTVTATTVNAGTIGNAGATLTGTLSTAAQTNITSVGTLTSLAVSGATTAAAITSSGTVIASAVQAGTIGNTGATLTGTLSTAAQPNITSLGTLSSLTTTGDVTVGGNLTIQGNTVTIGSNNLTVTDSIIGLHTFANGAPLISDDGRDIGVRFHYYKGADKHAFLGWENGTETLVYFANASEVSSNVTGTLGNVQFGSLTLSNTAATVLTVGGNTAINSTVYGRGVYDNSVRVVSTSTGAGNLTISGTGINLTAAGPGATTVGSANYIPVITTDAYGRVATLANTAISLPFASLTAIPTTLTGYGITDALSTSATIDGGTY